jgi:uncharacterized protein (DUF1015 family)
LVDFRPFRGIRFEPQVAGNLGQLICPPYDVISAADEQALKKRSPYNMVALELAEIMGQPVADRYQNAAQRYREWRTQGVLRQDKQPAYYLLRQRFPMSGGMAERYGLVGALRLEELGKGVLPHEHTGAAAKADRLSLMEAAGANFSSVMALFRDEGRLVETVRTRAMAQAPEAQFAGDDGQEYTLWLVTERQAVQTIHSALTSQPVYIADGHHRYETALTYLARRREEHSDPSPSAEFTMMTLIDFDDPGLVIMPYHRVVGGLPQDSLIRLQKRIAGLFRAQPVSVDLRSTEALERLVAQEGAERLALGILGPNGEGPYLLTLNNPTLLEPYVTQGQDVALREVEAWVLQEAALRPALGDGFEDYVSYVPEGQQALKMVQSGQAQIAFFLKGLRPLLFEQLVSLGIRLPRKSTYFHPKLPSGVIIKSLTEGL